MKETGIIMSGNHPKLILDGIKTMTRRVITPQPELVGGQYYWKNCSWTADKPHCPTGTLELPIDYCPYGQAGDRLWVKESYLHDPVIESGIVYKADNPEIPSIVKWKPSLFMFKWMARIWLEITEVRVERLQEIKPIDIIREGIMISGINPEADIKYRGALYDSFINLWDSLNAKRGYGWKQNPWVWVISFRRIDDGDYRRDTA